MVTLRTPPSAYLYKVGDATAVTLADGYRAVPVREGFLRNASAAEMSDALAAEMMPRDVLNIVFNPTLLELPDGLTLIDTGLGPSAPPTAGKLLANLAAAGASAGDIARVVISHFHGDHISGLRTAAGEPAFPQAEVLVPQPEWDFWMSEARFAAAPDAMKPTFELARRIFADDFGGRLRRYAWGDEVAPGLTALDTHGHTPGHTSFMLESAGERLVIWSDVTNHPALFVRNPDWAAGFDIDPDAARATRHRMLDMVAREKLRVAGFHFPFPSNGYIVNEGGRYRLVPSPWLPPA